MSENRTLLLDSAAALFDDLAGLEIAAAWPRFDAAGLATLLVPEDAGGFGGDWGDFFAVMRLAGETTLSLPIGETILATRLLVDAGLDVPTGPLSIATSLDAVPFGRHAAGIVVADGATLTLYRAASVTAAAASGDPLDAVTGDVMASAPSTACTMHLGAFLRVAQSAGALDKALRMAMDYTGQRMQFGKTLSQQQAVQQSLAILAVETAAIDVAGQGAAAALDRGEAAFEIAAAKLRTNMAIGTGTSIAHQVHGAIGFTHEYDLHRYTRRLMGWRSEFGNDRHWAERTGAFALKAGGAGLWGALTARTDKAA